MDGNWPLPPLVFRDRLRDIAPFMDIVEQVAMRCHGTGGVRRLHVLAAMARMVVGCSNVGMSSLLFMLPQFGSIMAASPMPEMTKRAGLGQVPEGEARRAGRTGPSSSAPPPWCS